jgi:RNA polymerase sigma factor (TIGR02999 family)
MSITRVLAEMESGNPAATGELLELLYHELKRLAAARLAREAPGQTLQATALVHEAFLRLVGPDNRPGHWSGRNHFFSAAAEAMRRILVENARRKGRIKRGGEGVRVDADLDRIEAGQVAPAEVLDVHEALERLGQRSPRKAELVKLRYFAGCSVAEAAAVLGIAPSTAEEDWTFARAWLRREWLRGEREGKIAD